MQPQIDPPGIAIKWHWAGVREEEVMAKYKPINLTGAFAAFNRDDQPVLVILPPHTTKYVIVHENEFKLREIVKKAGIYEFKVKRVTDGKEFSQSIHDSGLLIAFNLREEQTPEGPRMKWLQPIPSTAN